MNIYSSAKVTASDQEGIGSIWKPVDGVTDIAQESAWLSLESSQSWWRLELPHRSVISKVIIHKPSFIGNAAVKSSAMNGFAVYIGDFPVGNGSRNAMCGKPWKAELATAILIKCIDILVGNYLFVAAAAKEKAALHLSEINVFGCEGGCLALFQFMLCK